MSQVYIYKYLYSYILTPFPLTCKDWKTQLKLSSIFPNGMSSFVPCHSANHSIELISGCLLFICISTWKGEKCERFQIVTQPAQTWQCSLYNWFSAGYVESCMHICLI